MTSKTSQRRQPATGRSMQSSESDPLRWIWLVLISGLYFVRWWKPTEGTVLGDTLDLAVGWFLALALAGWLGLRETSWRIKWDALHWSVWLLVAGHILSGLIVIGTSGDRRAAVNMVWEWTALGVAFPLLRCTLTGLRARREWVIVSLAGVMTLCGYAMVQRHYFQPQLVVQYERLRSELDRLEQAAAAGDGSQWQRIQQLRMELLNNGLSANMLTGTGRSMLEGRLKHSTEALGRFALANTFAGLLLVWWLVLVIISVHQWQAYQSEKSAQMKPAPPAPLLRGEGPGVRGNRATSGTLTPAPSPPRTEARGELAICVGFVLGTVIVGYCLLLTKSRTAFVGCVAALAVWTLVSQWRWQISRRQVVLTSVAVGVASGGLILIAYLSGGLDRLVLAEAPKSLQYRLEFWWSSLGVIRESPLTGVGPGQFRQHYLVHKLPRSSEEIADPHNLVLDVWANGGLIALIGLLGIVFALGRVILSDLLRSIQFRARTSRSQRWATGSIPVAPTVRESGVSPAVVQKIPRPRTSRRNEEDGSEVTVAVWEGLGSPFRWGAVGGLLFLWLLGGGVESTLLAGLVVWIGLCWLLNWVEFPRILSSVGWAIAGGGLLVHLTGAGGIAMPAITQLMCVIAILATADEDPTGLQIPSWGNWAALLGGLGLFGAAFATAVQPVSLARSLWEQGDVGRSPVQQVQLYRRATIADPLAAEPWERLAEVLFRKWKLAAEPDERDFQQAVDALQHAIDRNPLSFHTHRAEALYFAEHAKLTGDESDKLRAVKSMQLAVARYPHHAELLADAAEVYHIAGNAQLSRTAAKQAILQDNINHQAGHIDKWLTEQVRARMVEMAPPE